MEIRHFTKSKPNAPNVIALANPRFYTEHTDHNGKITHVGFKVRGDAVNKEGNRYEVLFQPDDLPSLEDFLRMAARLQQTGLPSIYGEVDERVEEADNEELGDL